MKDSRILQGKIVDINTKRLEVEQVFCGVRLYKLKFSCAVAEEGLGCCPISDFLILGGKALPHEQQRDRN